MTANDEPRPDLSIVLPAYNEQASVHAAVDVYRAALDQAGIRDYEIIFVNDGSTDETGVMLDALAEADPRLRVLHHSRNQGQVRAILNGFRAARGRFVTHNGIDLPFQPRDLGRALACFTAGADVVVVERTDRASYGLVRKVLSRANVWLLRLLFGSPFRDHNFVQFFRREVIEVVPVRSTGVSTVTTELIVRSLRHGFRVVPVAAEYHRRQSGRSTITPRKVLHALGQTLWLWWLLRRPEPASVPCPPPLHSEVAPS
jgi:glycosyltransferase involved in cell wall biosynthesis